MWAGKTAQVKSTFTLAEDPGSIPCIYMVTHCHLELQYEGINTLF